MQHAPRIRLTSSRIRICIALVVSINCLFIIYTQVILRKRLSQLEMMDSARVSHSPAPKTVGATMGATPVWPTDNREVSRHQEVLDKLCGYPNVTEYTSRLLHIIDAFKPGRRYDKLVAVFDDLILDLWTHFKDNITDSERRLYSWEEVSDGATTSRHDINCSNIREVRIEKKIGSGYIKNVYIGDFRGSKVIVKNKIIDTDVVCGIDHFECAVYREVRIMNELILLDYMEHPMLVRVLGYCIHNGMHVMHAHGVPGVIGVFENGRKFTTKDTPKLQWEDKIKYAIEIADFLDYVEHSSIGTLTLYDLKPSQFVIVRNHFCVTDMDLVDSYDDPSCDDVNLKFTSPGDGHDVSVCNFINMFDMRYDFTIPCINGTCHETAQRHNMYRMYKIFIYDLLQWKYFPMHVQNEAVLLSRNVKEYMPAAELLRQLYTFRDHATQTINNN